MSAGDQLLAVTDSPGTAAKLMMSSSCGPFDRDPLSDGLRGGRSRREGHEPCFGWVRGLPRGPKPVRRGRHLNRCLYSAVVEADGIYPGQVGTGAEGWRLEHGFGPTGRSSPMTTRANGSATANPETGRTRAQLGAARREDARHSWQTLDDVEMRPIKFIDKPFWQENAFHLLVGRKGMGKGTHNAYLASRITRGELGSKRNVVWIATEDSASIDIKPRVVAAGGDASRIIVPTLDSEWVQLPRDIPEIGRVVQRIGNVGLTLIDPLEPHRW